MIHRDISVQTHSSPGAALELPLTGHRTACGSVGQATTYWPISGLPYDHLCIQSTPTTRSCGSPGWAQKQWEGTENEGIWL